MKNNDPYTPPGDRSGGGGGPHGGGRRRPEPDRLAPRPPKGFRVEAEGNALRVVVIDRHRQDSTAIRYDIRWSFDVDSSTQWGTGAGYARSTPVLSIDRTGKDGEEIPRYLADPKYRNGYFYCEGVGALGDRSEDYLGPVRFSSPIADGSIPDNVTHFQLSESGEIHGDTVVSGLSFSYVAPISPSFDGIQLYLQDYPYPGQMSQAYFHKYRGEPGGGADGFARFEVGRRKGTGTSIALSASTSVPGTATNYMAEANGGDLLEAFGKTAEILSVASNTALTLAANWPGPNGTATDWHFIAKVRVYAVSISKAGTRRPDIENSPYVDVIMDGLLSAPLAPSSLILVAEDNGIRIMFAQVQGIDVKEYSVYKSLGSTEDFSTAYLIARLPHDPIALSTGTLRTFIDREMTITQREQGQIFRYYVKTANRRDQESTSYVTGYVSCRLTSTEVVDPFVGARSGVLNLLYNAGLSGTDGSDVDWNSGSYLSQDGFNGMAGPPAGWTRWDGSAFGAAARPKHANGDEIKFPTTGAGIAYVYTEIAAWSSGANRRLHKGAMLVFQALLRHGGTLPTGTMLMYLEPVNLAGTGLDYTPRRYRDAGDDQLKYYAAGNDSLLEIAGSSLLTTYQLFFAVFKLDHLLETAKLRVNFGLADATQGDVYMRWPMLSLGEDLAHFTGQMVDPRLDWTGTNAGGDEIGDSSGGRRPFYQTP